MRKVLLSICSFILFTPSLTASACTYNFVFNLSNLPSYNWSSEEPYFSGYQTTKELDGKKIDNSGTLKYDNNQHFINYKNFNTGYKNFNSLKKQAVTGVPINSAFMPNGNYLKDFGVTKKSLLFQQVNSILDWDPKVDMDAKYNQSDYHLVNSEKVASKWVNSQDSNIKTSILGLAEKATSGMSTIVGSNRIFNYNFNNWQYVNNYVGWAGAINEGIIVPPPADDVDAAHVNGTKVYGQIFLDGYHGLTKSLLRDFLKRDQSGRFIIVDILIKMAVYMGFDGWFYNNEPNGALPNGIIMNNEDSVTIIKQFNDTVKTAKNPAVRALSIIGYKNGATLGYIKSLNIPEDRLSSQIAAACNGNFLQDFYTYPNQSLEWSKKHPNYSSFNIYNMYNVGGWVNGSIFYNEKRLGTRDVRELTQVHLNPQNQPYTNMNQEIADMKNNKWHFTGNNVNSIALFQATTPLDLASMYLDKLPKDTMKPTQLLDNDLYAAVYANYYDDMLYTGAHRYLTNDDKGTTSWDPNFSVKGLSYGIGDLYQENTILFDNGNHTNISNFKTDFSTGQGQFFIDKNGVVNKFPWNNRRLEDTQPTYKWDVEVKNADGSYQPAGNNISGFYDYYQVFRKGNSLALGSGFNTNTDGKIADNNGRIKPFNLNQEIHWNIMGTNYSNFNKTVNLVYRISDANPKDYQTLVDNIPAKFLITFADGTTKTIESRYQPKIINDNGWVVISCDLSSLNQLHEAGNIAKIGLDITPSDKSENINFNVGQLTISQDGSAIPSLATNNLTADPVAQLMSEYAISRKDQGYDLRINLFSTSETVKDQIAYYEFYFYDKTINKYYFVGMTTNNNYFIKNLLTSNKNLDGDQLVIATFYKNHNLDTVYQSWVLEGESV